MAIQILPARLANQIAAGEVVERPASVVKELVENSIDAGATRIEVDIEKGGSKLIRVFDNGLGINKDELSLALSRHATSKIATLDDLEAIISLGFRGEALASISSVSRLTLTSRTAAQSEAWSAFAEGREMTVKLKPAAHPVGSTVEVLDLFFNTPARRKFLRSEKTEFNHIDELLKRIALSRFDLTLILRHNGKQVRLYQAAISLGQKQKRLAAICGNNFAKSALKIELISEDLTLNGWVCSPNAARAQNDIQHCFVNKRMMKDKLINHAIRQGYELSLKPEQFAAFVLYIDIAPSQVDVNVHPAKHEVRFHQARLVHDFIYSAVRDALLQLEETPLAYTDAAPTLQGVKQSSSGNNLSINSRHPSQARFAVKEPTSYTAMRDLSTNDKDNKAKSVVHWQPSTQVSGQTQNLYQKLLNPAPKVTPVNIYAPSMSLGKALVVAQARFLLLEQNEELQLLDLDFASFLLMQGKLKQALSEGLVSQPLLIPQKLNVTEQEMQLLLQYQSLLVKFGIIFRQKDQKQIVINAVCHPLRECNLQMFFNNLFVFISSSGCAKPISLTNMFSWLAQQLMVKRDKFTLSEAIGLINELENCWQDELVAYYPKLLRTVNLAAVIDSFEA